MEMKQGESVPFRLMPGMETYQGIIVSIDETTLTLQTQETVPATITVGRYLIIPEADTGLDYYTEIMDITGDRLQLKRLWTGKRDYFRVCDVLPLVVRKVSGDRSLKRSRLVAGYGSGPSEPTLPDESVSPQVWRMLVDISAKLDALIEKQNLDSAGLSHAENVAVSISASGIKFALQEPAIVGDIIEIKMSLPLYPPVGIITFGEVVRVKTIDQQACEVAVRFINMDDDVRDEIIQYTLKRQRDIIREHK
jgi:hypothetical protein